jgi:UDP-glucose 4-epimerase
VEAVFHLAAQISVAASMEDPLETVDINTRGTLVLLQACRRQGVRSLVFSSSAAVYGDNPELPKRELMLPEPRSPYAVTKLDGEYYLDIFAAGDGMAATALRYFNVYGPRQDPDSPYAAAIPAFIARALEGRTITIYGDGGQTRDFVYVADVARANMAAAGLLGDGSPMEPGFRVFNVGGGSSITIQALAESIVSITGSASAIEHGPERAGDVRHSRADVSRIQEALGFQPQVAVDDGLRSTIEAYRDS